MQNRAIVFVKRVTINCYKKLLALLYSIIFIGPDFHRAMVATGPGETLRIGCRPVRNWTQLQFRPRPHWGELIVPHRHPGYLNRWVTGLAKAAAAIRINHSGIPTNAMAVRCMVPSIRKICHSVNSSKTWEAVWFRRIYLIQTIASMSSSRKQ